MYAFHNLYVPQLMEGFIELSADTASTCPVSTAAHHSNLNETLKRFACQTNVKKKSPPVFANHEVTHHNTHTHPPIKLVFILCLRVVTSFAVTTVGRGNTKCYELNYLSTQRAGLAQQVQ